MGKFIIKMIVAALILNNVCFAADLELSDVIKEAREAAKLKRVNSETTIEKTSCDNAQNTMPALSSENMRTKQSSQPIISGEQNANEKITPDQNMYSKN